MVTGRRGRGSFGRGYLLEHVAAAIEVLAKLHQSAAAASAVADAADARRYKRLAAQVLERCQSRRCLRAGIRKRDKHTSSAMAVCWRTKPSRNDYSTRCVARTASILSPTTSLFGSGRLASCSGSRVRRKRCAWATNLPSPSTIHMCSFRVPGGCPDDSGDRMGRRRVWAMWYSLERTLSQTSASLKAALISSACTHSVSTSG